MKNHKKTGGSSMDPTAIATTTIAILSPYLAKAGEAAANKVGEAAWEKAAEIYDAIQARFVQDDDDDYPSQTLKRFEEQPDSRKAALQEILEEILSQDSDFAQSLSHLLKEADEAGAGAVFNVSVFGGEVGEIINVDKLKGGLTINNNKKD